MNCVARTVFPDPDGPATSTEYPDGMPPPSISSRPATPTDSRGGRAFVWPAARRWRLRWAKDQSREDLNAAVGDAKGVQAGNGRLAAHLHDVHLPHHRIAVDTLVQPDEAIRHREDRVVLGLGQLKLADQKCRGLPAGQPHAQLLDEVLNVELPVLPLCRLNDRSERIDDHDCGRRGLHFLDDALQHLVEPAVRAPPSPG